MRYHGCFVALLTGILLPYTVIAQPVDVGEWGAELTIQPLNFQGQQFAVRSQAIHTVLLHTGKVLVIDQEFNPVGPTAHLAADVVLIDPTLTGPNDPDRVKLVAEGIGSYPQGTNDHWLYCSGHCVLANGNVLFGGGGDCDPGFGTGTQYATTVYTPSATGIGTLSGGPNEEWPPNPGEPSAPCRRYYSTYTTLHDGNVLVVDGRCDTVSPSYIGYPNTPVILHAQGDPGAWWWEPLYDARHDYGLPGSNNFDLDPYSFMWGLSDGSAFMGGGWFFADDSEITPAELLTRRLNPSLELWSTFPEQPTLAPGGSAVMYQKDKILKGGGFKPLSASDPRVEPSHKAYTVHATSSATSWTAVDDMPFEPGDPNEHAWITMLPLPDGQVFSVGGKAGSKPDLFNPYASSGQQWKQLAALQFNRQVHHSAVTLIDGSVFVGGGAGLSADPNTQNYQIYKPPYFFWTSSHGPRPSFTPLTNPQIYYNTAFNLTTYDAVTKVRLIRTGATTHSFDQNTRMIDLDFSLPWEGTVRVLPPLNGHVAPPGWYMLFIATETNGTYPSVGQFVQLLPPPS